MHFLRKTTMIKLILGTSYPDDGLVSESTHWSKFWIGHNSPSDLTQDTSPLHSIWITTFLAFIPILAKTYSTGTPTVVITATNIYGYQSPCLMPVLSCVMGTHINLTGVIFATETNLSTSIFYFVNRTTGRCFIPYFTIDYFAAKDTYVDEFYI